VPTAGCRLGVEAFFQNCEISEKNLMKEIKFCFASALALNPFNRNFNFLSKCGWGILNSPQLVKNIDLTNNF